MKLSLVLAGVLLAGCADSKKDISSVPISIDEVDAKEDSPTRPSKGFDMRVTEQINDQLTRTRGWIAHQIQLTGGRVDIDVSGLENGESLDTIMYVFGPRKPNGKYPALPIAFNDDFEPGVNFGSHIVLDVPADGIYQVVISTYENYIYFPRNVSRGDYQLMVKCRSEAFEACGPAVSGIDGQCWADDDCLDAGGKPLHCEGEVVCAPGTQCFFTRMGVCVEDYVYMTYSPKQCGNNPWNVTAVSDTSAFPVPDLAVIKEHYGRKGVVFDQLGQLNAPEPLAHCFSCNCIRGDELIVRVKAARADVLAAEGWLYSAPAVAAMVTEPIACGGNAWQTETASGDAELELVDTWLAGQGAQITKRGFMYSAEPRVVCKACSCPRGDYLVAFPADESSHGLLSTLGFADVYIP